MNINSTLFAQLIVFLILVWFTMTYVWPPIAKALDERALKIAEGLSASDKAKSELVLANKRVEEELAKSRNETAVRLADAERKAQTIIEQAKVKAVEEAAQIVASANQDVAQQLLKAREALREDVAGLVVKGAEQILRREVNVGAHADMLNRLKSEL
jgi:F-type H+-transporting ATPase subunit b